MARATLRSSHAVKSRVSDRGISEDRGTFIQPGGGLDVEVRQVLTSLPQCAALNVLPQCPALNVLSQCPAYDASCLRRTRTGLRVGGSDQLMEQMAVVRKSHM